MRVLWFAVVLALVQCNNGQEDATIKQLIDEIFQAPTEKPGPRPPVPAPQNPVPESTCSSCAAIAENPANPSLEPKVSNVSRPLSEFVYIQLKRCHNFVVDFLDSRAKWANVFLTICA